VRTVVFVVVRAKYWYVQAYRLLLPLLLFGHCDGCDTPLGRPFTVLPVVGPLLVVDVV